MMYSATIRELEVIGEAASKLSAELKEKHPEVPWREIKDFRNILAHEYFGVDSEVVWDIVTEKIPVLQKAVTAIQETAR